VWGLPAAILELLANLAPGGSESRDYGLVGLDAGRRGTRGLAQISDSVQVGRRTRVFFLVRNSTQEL